MKNVYILFISVVLSTIMVGCEKGHTKQEIIMMHNMYTDYSIGYQEEWYDTLIEPMINSMSSAGYIIEEPYLNRIKKDIKDKKDMVNAFDIDEISMYEEELIRGMYRKDLTGDSKELVDKKVQENKNATENDLIMMKYVTNMYDDVISKIKPGYNYTGFEDDISQLKNIKKEVDRYVKENEYIIKD